MLYPLCLLLALTFCSSWASDQPDGFFTKISALITTSIKQVSVAEEHNKAQRLAQARQAVQALDTHLTPNITNIVIASLGTGTTIINVPRLWQTYLTHTNNEAEEPIIQFGSIMATPEKFGNRVTLKTVFRSNHELSMKEFICDVVNDEGFSVATIVNDKLPLSLAPFAEHLRPAVFRGACKKLLPEKNWVNKDGQQMTIEPLDHIVGQGARNFKVCIAEDTGNCLIASDPNRFNLCRTWFVLSKLKLEEAKID